MTRVTLIKNALSIFQAKEEADQTESTEEKKEENGTSQEKEENVNQNATESTGINVKSPLHQCVYWC